MPDMDESRMERAMQALASETEGLDENDPRQAARMMRKLSEAMGTHLGSGMEEVISRMEAGEDPDQIEADIENAPHVCPGAEDRAHQGASGGVMGPSPTP